SRELECDAGAELVHHRAGRGRRSERDRLRRGRQQRSGPECQLSRPGDAGLDPEPAAIESRPAAEREHCRNPGWRDAGARGGSVRHITYSTKRDGVTGTRPPGCGSGIEWKLSVSHLYCAGKRFWNARTNIREDATQSANAIKDSEKKNSGSAEVKSPVFLRRTKCRANPNSSPPAFPAFP